MITDLYLGDYCDCLWEGLGKPTNCHWLQALNIQNCVHVASETLVLISRNLKNLRELEVLNCKSITTLDVLDLKRSLPMCDVRYELLGYHTDQNAFSSVSRAQVRMLHKEKYVFH